jgi:uncharacterized protein YbjQ (UPF0145 family)
MRISFTDEVEGGRVLYSIGRVQAASPWRGAQAEIGSDALKHAALQALIETAEEVDADAIIGVDYAVDGVQHTDLTALDLRRVSVSGIAVKLAHT